MKTILKGFLICGWGLGGGLGEIKLSAKKNLEEMKYYLIIDYWELLGAKNVINWQKT